MWLKVTEVSLSLFLSLYCSAALYYATNYVLLLSFSKDGRDEGGGVFEVQSDQSDDTINHHSFIWVCGSAWLWLWLCVLMKIGHDMLHHPSLWLLSFVSNESQAVIESERLCWLGSTSRPLDNTLDIKSYWLIPHKTINRNNIRTVRQLIELCNSFACRLNYQFRIKAFKFWAKEIGYCYCCCCCCRLICLGWRKERKPIKCHAPLPVSFFMLLPVRLASLLTILIFYVVYDIATMMILPCPALPCPLFSKSVLKHEHCTAPRTPYSYPWWWPSSRFSTSPPTAQLIIIFIFIFII